MNCVGHLSQTNAELIPLARQGHPRAIARLMTQIENNPAAAQAIVQAIYSETGRAHIVGITGPPGSGKSSLVNELAKVLRARDQRVAIVAVDPSSPFTGGALLGDRVRMLDLSGDSGVFVRSMASRGSLGGLARATSAVVKVLDFAGFDTILVETVGAGQAEVDIATAAHTTVVLEAPGMGDDVQSIKAGILEIADILVVNKADRPGANRTVKSLEMMLHLGMAPATDNSGHHRDANSVSPPAEQEPTGWSVPVLQTVATTGEGVADLATTIARHRDYLRSGDGWEASEAARSRREVEQLLQTRLMDRLTRQVPPIEREQIMTAVIARELDPYSAAEQLFDLVTAGPAREEAGREE